MNRPREVAPGGGLRVLVLNPYAGGSHRAFMDGWREHTRHTFTILELPGRHWKWRMRHGAWTLAERARSLVNRGEAFDAVVSTDMLDLPAWRAFAPSALAALPTAIYFHENQLCYPDALAQPRDLHFGFTNFLSAASADAVWFNSEWHRQAFLDACAELIAQVPDHPPESALVRVRDRAVVLYPGFSLTAQSPACVARENGPCHILWAARWEPDKGPEDFFAALRRLAHRGVGFRVSVVGRSAKTEPPLFSRARHELGDRVVRWGWQKDRATYEQTLRSADVVVSSARHEFFGIAVVEAVAAGAFPLLPDRLAYPEVFSGFAHPDRDSGFYDGSVEHLAERMLELCARHDRGELWQGDSDRGLRSVARYAWTESARALDERARGICTGNRQVGSLPQQAT